MRSSNWTHQSQSLQYQPFSDLLCKFLLILVWWNKKWCVKRQWIKFRSGLIVPSKIYKKYLNFIQLERIPGSVFDSYVDHQDCNRRWSFCGLCIPISNLKTPRRFAVIRLRSRGACPWIMVASLVGKDQHSLILTCSVSYFTQSVTGVARGSPIDCFD